MYNKDGFLLTEENDPINMGTYNYCGPSKKFILHYLLDVATYNEWGNVKGQEYMKEPRSIKDFYVYIGINFVCLYIAWYYVLWNQEKKTMDKDKKLRLLIAPLIFITLLFVPGMILDLAPNTRIQAPDLKWTIFLAIEWTALIIWSILFHYIPLGLYIVMLIVYTVVSWRWILKQKKGNAVYAIVWIVLCVLSIFLYWKIGDLYYATMHG